MTKAEAFTEALAMYLKVRKLNTGLYKGMEEFITYIQVEFHIKQDRKIVEKLRKELIQNADCETHSEVRRIDTTEILVVSFRWSFVE